MKPNLLASLFLALCYLGTAHSCLIRQVSSPTEKNQFRGNGLPTRRMYDKKCVCGEVTSYTDRNWDVQIAATAPGTENFTKLCVGTVVAHNLVVTSHECLALDNKHILPYDVWKEPPKFRENNVANVSNIYVFFSEGITMPLSLKFNLDYIVYAAVDAASANDIAIIKVKEDLFQAGHRPVCLPANGMQDLSETIHHRYGYYYGPGRGALDDETPETRLANELVIMDGEECDMELGLGDFSTKGSLCTRTFTTLPRVKSGPLLTTNEAGYFIHHGRHDNGTALPIPSQTAFLVGLSTVPIRRPDRKSIGYTYFANVFQNIDFIERVAKEMNSSFCETPPFEKIKVAEDAQLKLEEWPFEVESIKPRSETLDCACGLKNSKSSERVSAGETAIPHEFGWIIKYFWTANASDTELKGPQVCGASIINDRVILTAAHCTYHDGMNKSDENRPSFDFVQHKKVFIGSHYTFESKDPNARKLEVKEIIPHPGYTLNKKNNVVSYDLALIILDKPLEFATATTQDTVSAKDIRPICLSKATQKIDLNDGTKLTVMGWGLQRPWGKPISPQELQKAQVTVRNMKFCVDKVNSIVPDNVFCVYDNKSEFGITQGDSGGPLVFEKNSVKEKGKYYQVGVVSNTVNLLDIDGNLIPKDWLTFLTDVQKHLPFIEYYSNLYGAKWCKQ